MRLAGANSNERPDAIVVGAGIVGAACARELANEGLRVLVVDRDIVGGGATSAGMGQIVVMDDSDAEFAITKFSQQLWDELADELPAAVERDPCGTVWVAADDEEMEIVARKERFYVERGMRAEVLDSETLYRHEPSLRPGFRGGLRVPGDTVIYSPSATNWLMNQARAAGATLELGGTVTAVDENGLQLNDGSRLDADLIVNAAGTGALGLMATPLPGLTVRPRKGHLVITERPPRVLPPSGSGARLLEERALSDQLVRRVQRTAAQDRADPAGFVATVRSRHAGSRTRHPPPHDRASDRIHAGPG